MRLGLGYPQEASEIAMLQRLQLRHPIDDLDKVASAEEVLDCQRAVRAVHADEKVSRYIVQLIQATRDHPDLFAGRQSASLDGAVARRAIICCH